MQPKTILKTIVGSHAHGLATPESDYDYRGVFVLPTKEILKIGGDRQKTNWNEGEEDSTSWEIGHFLSLSLQSNPTILETYLAPRIENPLLPGMPYPLNHENLTTMQRLDYWGDRLRELFPYVWSSRRVRDAFIGYGLNQRKKFLENKDKRQPKYAAAFLRTLYNAYELLTTGTFTVKIADTYIGQTVKRYKKGDFTIGEVVDVCHYWIEQVDEAYEKSPEHHADIDKVNNFLLDVRKAFWNGR
jgi:predicted nucleotidyltransferase